MGMPELPLSQSDKDREEIEGIMASQRDIEHEHERLSQRHDGHNDVHYDKGNEEEDATPKDAMDMEGGGVGEAEVAGREGHANHGDGDEDEDEVVEESMPMSMSMSIPQYDGADDDDEEEEDASRLNKSKSSSNTLSNGKPPQQTVIRPITVFRCNFNRKLGLEALRML